MEHKKNGLTVKHTQSKSAGRNRPKEFVSILVLLTTPEPEIVDKLVRLSFKA